MTSQEAGKEYNRRLQFREYKEPEILKNGTVADIVSMQEFSENLTSYMNEQKKTRASVQQTRQRIRESGKYPAPEKRPTIDAVIELGLMKDAQTFSHEFINVVNHESEYPAEIRKYVMQLGTLAYRMTVEQLICKENPDMARLIEISRNKI